MGSLQAGRSDRQSLPPSLPGLPPTPASIPPRPYPYPCLHPQALPLPLPPSLGLTPNTASNHASSLSPHSLCQTEPGDRSHHLSGCRVGGCQMVG